MKEIEEKDLEKASGGLSIHAGGCDNFEAKRPGPFNQNICSQCKYFEPTGWGGGVCTFNQSQGE